MITESLTYDSFLVARTGFYSALKAAVSFLQISLVLQANGKNKDTTVKTRGVIATGLCQVWALRVIIGPSLKALCV